MPATLHLVICMDGTLWDYSIFTNTDNVLEELSKFEDTDYLVDFWVEMGRVKPAE